MKHTKRLLTWILAVVLVVASFALVACVDKPDAEQLDVTLPVLADNQMVVVVKNADDGFDVYTVTLGENGTAATTAEGVLNYLQQQGRLSVEWVNGEYGKYINSIGGAVPTAANEYIEVFTSVTADMGTWAGVSSYAIGDILISSAAVGVTELGVCAGAIIYFQVSTY